MRAEGHTPSVAVISAFKDVGEDVFAVVQSVQSQSYQNVQHYIVEGGGSMESRALLKGPCSMPNTHCVIEPDKGIGDAWNKGVSRCKEDLVVFLGAGDRLEPTNVERAVRLYESMNRPENVIIAGICMREHADGSVRRDARKYHRLWRPISLRVWFPTCFIPRRLLEAVGPFSLEKKIAVDSDWLLRAIARGATFAYGGHLIRMDATGVSERLWARGYLEYFQSLEAQGLLTPYDQLVSWIYRAVKRISGHEFS